MNNPPTRKSRYRRVAGGPAPAEGPSAVRKHTLSMLSRLALYGMIGAWVLATAFGLLLSRTGSAPVTPPAIPNVLAGLEILPTATFTSTRVPPTPTLPPPPEIAILAGHWSHDDPEGVTTVHDTGALCEDGLREVTINKGVADKTVVLLRSRGYRVDLLEEFDPRLKEVNPDYAPAVFLAIHSDSCVHGPDYPLATGFKIAHAEPSENPREDARLVACLRRDYQTAVEPYNMTFNENTITTDMTAYHGFREIVRTTPAAIIELGFMYGDRVALSLHQDELARGVANGLDAFLKGDRCGVPIGAPVGSETPGM